MDDTSAEVRAVHAAALSRMSPGERLIAATGMHAAARAMVLASMPCGMSPEEVIYALLQRMYGDEVNEETRRAASGAVRGVCAPASALRARPPACGGLQVRRPVAACKRR